MSFYEDEDVFPRQHRLNLSVKAIDVLESDKLAFAHNGKEIKDQTIRNTIIQNYYKDADASIERRLTHYSNELSDLFASLKDIPSETKDEIIDVLFEKKKKELIKKAKLYRDEKAGTQQFTLSSDNYDYFVCNIDDDEGTTCEENKQCYNGLSQYLKSLIEEYVRLPYVKREEIYFKHRFQLIRQAIEANVQLKIKTLKGNCYTVYPYKISTDPLAMANYLVGYCRPYNEKDAKLRPITFRISALDDIKKTCKKAFLTTEQKNKLEHAIKARGVQFMYMYETEIHVKLTDAGYLKYQRQLHLRPAIAKVLENNEYVFNCTQDQAEFYFFKFGKDAEIISPPELRKKFFERYQEALQQYNNTDSNS